MLDSLPRVRAVLVAGLFVAVLALPAVAESAQPPAVGWWRGVNGDGVRVSFAVVREGHGRAVTGIVLGCDDFGRVYSGAHPSTDVLFRDRAGNHPTGAPNAHAAYPVLRSGRLDTRDRSIRPPPGSASYEREQTAEPPFRARLSGRRGRVTLTEVNWGTNACARHDPSAGDVVDVSMTAPAARPGVWRLKGLLPFGDVVDYAAAKFYVQPSGVAGSFKGMFLGPSIPPASAPRPNPLFSPWPAPCFSQNVANTLLSEGSMEYDFGEHFLAHYGVIEPGGAMTTPGRAPGEVPGGFQFVSTTGRFDSPTHYRGVYQITENPAIFNPNYCVDVPIPFEAVWERSASPAVVGGLTPRRAPRTPRPEPVLPVPPEPLDYVALGDSYSSGEGVPPFDAGTDTPENRCHRSTAAYSRRLDLPGYRLRRSFFACSGAITDNVGRLDAASGQIGGAVQYPSETAVQFGRLNAEQWGATDMVTLTIGGNDAQFSSVLSQCLVFNCHRGRRARRIVSRIAREVPPKLASTYAGVGRVAPNATVFVLGYPQLFPDRPRARCPIGKRVVSRPKQIFLRKRGERLNRAIRRKAAEAGFHYVDVERAFRGHEPCGRKSEWIHAIVLRGGIAFSFHPNRAGQGAYARELRRYVLCLAGHGWQFLGSGMPANPRGRRVPSACT